MNYQNYDDYVRGVHGYSPYVQNNYTYNEPEDMYSYQNVQDQVIEQKEDITIFYPEIYKIVYPMVCRICNINQNSKLTKELLEQMTDEIYLNIEPEEETSAISTRAPLKNGDVINPNSKDPKPEINKTRQTNFLLRDLIKILLLKERQRPIRPHFRPQTPPPPQMRPENQGRPPIMPRPRYY